MLTHFKISFCCLLLMLLSTKMLFATHDRAGEITSRYLGNNTFEFVLVLYTEYKPGGGGVVNNDATLVFSDNTSEKADYDKIPAPIIRNNVERRTYHFTHTFPGPGFYTVSYQNENRNADILNINGGNSVLLPFYVEAQVSFGGLDGKNTSPRLLLDPVDFGFVNQVFLHNPNAFDEDGDSLSFKLVPCKQDIGVEVPNYSLPAASKSFTINERTGEIKWDAPPRVGLYNIAIRIEEYRNGRLIGYLIRDMQIIVKQGANVAPIVQAIRDTCVVAGKLLEQQVLATDQPNVGEGEDDNDMMDLVASGGPFEVSPKAQFPPTIGKTGVSQLFQWTPDCSLVRKQPYQVVFKAIDHATVPLVGMTTWRITVIAPAPENLQAKTNGNKVELTWDVPSNCAGKAVGYKIYRKTEPKNFVPSACQTGVPNNLGYTLIKTLKGINNSTYTDDNQGKGLAPGINYCYRIVLYFLDKSESYASEEACTTLKRNIPVITHVDVVGTGIQNGSVAIAWAKPDKQAIDTTSLTGFYPPYSYKLYRAVHEPNAIGTAEFNTIYEVTKNQLYELTDTSFIDNAINTKDKQFTYKLEFYAQTGDKQLLKTLVGTTQLASSPYIKLSAGDNKVRISWNDSVPWNNHQYKIYRIRADLSPELIAKIDTQGYLDANLTNGEQYCYYIETIGDYSAAGLVSPIINRSQKACAIAIDNELPCAPQLIVKANCATFSDSLLWTLPSSDCVKEIIKYEVYRSDFTDSPPKLLAIIDDRNNLNLFLNNQIESIAGCFTVIAIDSVQARASSNSVCVDNCPHFVLPNVFTPDGDGVNDYFIPFQGDSTRFNKDIQLEIYSRWGDLVFVTNDKQINWDGTHYQTHQKLPAGTYYYVCNVNEIKVEGIRPRIIKGFITILP